MLTVHSGFKLQIAAADAWLIRPGFPRASGIPRPIQFVRGAIGQVLDYVYQIARYENEAWRPSILLPGKPSDDLVGLVNSLGIQLVWETELGQFSHASQTSDDVRK